MPATLVVARGPSLFLVGPAPEPPVEFRLRTSPGSAVRPAADARELASLRGLRETLEGRAAREGLATVGPRTAESLSRSLGVRVGVASPAAYRSAIARLPSWPAAERRSYLLELARASLDRQFRSPEEIVISLAREEERFERAVEREERAAEAFVSPAGTALSEHAGSWAGLRQQLKGHHRELRRRLEEAAVRLLPNLSAVVSPRIAARLLAASGGLATISRISASRLQLLGARRRPSPDRGPRYGLLYRADCLNDVPMDRRPAFARSVAALAVIAARADATTRSDIAQRLLLRRNRRAEELRRRAR